MIDITTNHNNTNQLFVVKRQTSNLTLLNIYDNEDVNENMIPYTQILSYVSLFDLQILITHLVSSDYPFGIFRLPIWYLQTLLNRLIWYQPFPPDI